MNAKRDQNDIGLGLGVSSVDGTTPTALQIDPVTGYLLASRTTDTITATLATRCKRDQNDRPTMYGVSSTDGVTLVPIRTDTNGVLLTA